MRPWISWFTSSGGTNLSTLTIRPVRVFQKSETREMQSQVIEMISEAREGNRRKLKNYIYILQVIRTSISTWVAKTGCQGLGLIVLGVGVCFGAIYCIAWAFSSPTHGELLIWRISSVVITAISFWGSFWVFVWQEWTWKSLVKLFFYFCPVYCITCV